MAASDYLFMTGATGFVGSHTLRRLLARPPDSAPWGSIKALVRNPRAAEELRALGVEPVPGDLLEPSPALREAIAGARYVLHCAEAPFAHYPEQRPRMDAALLESVDPRRTARVLYVCGSSYFGAKDGVERIDERTPQAPMGGGPAYEGALRTLRAGAKQGLDYAAAFIAGVYGPASWFTRQYLQALEQDQPIPVLEPPPVWPYVHIEDCARALEFLLTLDAARLEAAGREVIIADDTPVPMTAFIEELARATGRTARLERLGSNELRARLHPFQFTYLSANMPHSNARLRSLGFQCQYPSVGEGVPALGLASR